MNDAPRMEVVNKRNTIRTNDDIPDLILFNTKSRSKESLKTIVPRKVSMYTCGPTVYDYAHVGNFRAFLTYDLVKRVLLYFGYDVTHICNLTDVDDKIINRANENKLPNGKISELTLKFENYFFEDLKALNVILADKYPRATDHIPEMMDMILELAEKDLAYETDDGSWYFATSNKEGYGEQLVQLNRDEMEMSTKSVGNDMKRNYQDFALWKAYKENVDREDATWELPGKIQKGRPGWHVECSAMARKYLGDTIDIHGGGCDLQFPHHENEIAQSEGATGTTFCNCWVHNGFVNINDEKMSKSLGNFLTLRTACPKPDDVRAFRFLIMSSQYQKQLSYTSDGMVASKRALKRIDKVMQQINDSIIRKSDTTDTESDDQQKKSLLDNDIAKNLENFEKALLDDLSMPRASASLFSLIKIAENEFKQEEEAAAAAAASEDDNNNNNTDSNNNNMEVMDKVMDLVAKRTDAKEAKDWDLADSLRTRIVELGFVVKDVKGGDPIVTKIES
ncbi:cysteinyl-tRNA synthetase [Fragilariopsis cylindrus CCMP1102]|uniref:cysteine--tRNA ligase n=1 Tax=Fragilariopsis cylindrus CCMP1102 TaxID=635003 RepID=A0A1E7FJT4_9STRA|nr:cysteinyl-tRNA synthetase [Fragilariopsis cylindrus CCMP1102]|eukprot:OEU18426.1 cysteinyl-tRNA synthetase [Fragilariopsis cylindrus CCMP1102]